jgi:hypothetical protein
VTECAASLVLRITAPGTVVRRRIEKFAVCAPRAGPDFRSRQQWCSNGNGAART